MSTALSRGTAAGSSAIVSATRSTYTPALPFVEGLLPPSSYWCERVALPNELVTSALLTAREDKWLDLAQASHISRVAWCSQRITANSRSRSGEATARAPATLPSVVTEIPR